MQDTDKMILTYSKQAETGDASAQYNLGLCYYYGKGVTQNYKEAVKWFKKSSEQGNCLAQSNLGLCFRKGEGVLTNYIEAVKLFEKAAEQGDLVALYNLAICYYNGHGVEQSYEKAADIYKQVAEESNISEGHVIGGFHSETYREPDSKEEAMQWYRIASAKIESMEIQLHNALLAEDASKRSCTEILKKLDDVTEEHTTILSNHQNIYNEISDLKQENQIQAKEIISLQASINTKENMIEDLKKQKLQVEGILKQAKIEVSQGEEKLEEKERQLQSQICLTQKLTSQTDINMNTINQLNKEMSELKNVSNNTSSLLAQREIELSEKTGINRQLERKTQILTYEISDNMKQIAQLKTQKPFIRKVNILRWIDFFALAFFFGTMLDYYYNFNLNYYDYGSVSILVSGIIMLLLTVVEQFLLHNGNRGIHYIWHGILELLLGLIALVPVTFHIIESGNILCSWVVLLVLCAAIRFWNGIISFIKEIFLYWE